jgi:peptidoglycan hydrolase-like protein with peptidoglycan-binding domain
VRRIVAAVRRPHGGRVPTARSLAYAGALVALAATFAGAPATMADTVGSAAGGATASSEVIVKRGHRGPAVRQIQRKLSITADGVFGPLTERAVRRIQRRRGLVADGIVGPITRGALGLAPFSRSAVRRVGGDSGRLPRILRLIALCESGGNPRAVSANGRYRGKYQFSRATWRAIGGTGDPAKAPESVQDRMAAKLLAARGTSPWPNCA